MEQKRILGNKCNKHPKYKGKKKPTLKIPCFKCLQIYLNLRSGNRAGYQPTRIQKDKTRYTRKEKHTKPD